MHKNTSSIMRLRQEIQTIAAAIRQRKEVLALMQDIRNTYTYHSDMGWLISVVAEGPGTFLAVSSGRKAKTWDELVRNLEKDISVLEIDKKLKEQEIHHILTIREQYADQSSA